MSVRTLHHDAKAVEEVKRQYRQADIVIVGGGTGGCAAALAAAKSGMRVVMTEETDWIGGQLTSQAVPPDEHRWIEQFGCTAAYREFRDRVRQYYRDNYPLTEEARANPALNPGNAWVSRLCHEPRVALQVLEDMLAPYVNSGQIAILHGYRPVDALTKDDRVEQVTVRHLVHGAELALRGSYFLDATECGDVLPLAGAEYVVGAEARAETGEPHAADKENPLDVQAFTFVFAVDYAEGEDHTIDKPEQYEAWRNYMPAYSAHPLFSWTVQDVNRTDKAKTYAFMPDGTDPMPLWTYRRVIDRKLLTGVYSSDISLINWVQNDYAFGSIIDVPAEERERHLASAKQLSLSLLYWLQTEAPRPDGGCGYPGLRLRRDVLGTEDGLAKYPYIRESRRIKAVYTVTEHDVSREIRPNQGVRVFEDSVGVGSYHLDLHHTSVTHRSFYIPSYPYEIPLGALLPVRLRNLLPACKNIGTTQVTNACYRLHPTEWNIGESVGYLAAYCIERSVTPHEVRADRHRLGEFQDRIRQEGVQIHWPDTLDL